MSKNIILTAIVAAVVSVASFAIINQVWEGEPEKVRIEHHDMAYTPKTLFTTNNEGDLVPLDFTGTASKTMPAIVQITSKVPYSSGRGQSRELPDPFREFFDDDFFPFRFENRGERGEQPQEEHYGIGMGSGVIINPNGYIVTNNHVIENAKEVEVVLNDNKKYKAEVIGTDPTTDLGLLKIDEKDLPTIKMVNSDDVQIGEWVLALGHPLSLSKTVTAGIVSAIGRNIDIIRQGGQPYAIESFIQTDAAINKGNSGGALVNLNGDLIGINAAIASPTGYYSGYGFAIPSNLVNKVVEDLMTYGEVRRGILGISIQDLSNPRASYLADSLGIYNGVYVAGLIKDGPAKAAGVKEGDIIIGADGHDIPSSPKLLEYIGQKRPGDVVELKVNRDGSYKEIAVTLKAQEKLAKEMAVSEEEKEVLRDLGLELSEASEEELAAIDKEFGLKVDRVRQNGKIFSETEMKSGFIITDVDRRKIKSIDDFIEAVNRNTDGVLIKGYYPGDSRPTYYGFGAN